MGKISISKSFFKPIDASKERMVTKKIFNILISDFDHNSRVTILSQFRESGYLEFDQPYLSDIDPSTQLNLSLIYRQIGALFSKDASIDRGIDRQKVAYEAFLMSEINCRLINDRLSNPALSDKFFDDLIIDAKRICKRILGDFPGFENLDYDFGPGANTCTRKITNPSCKLAYRLEVNTLADSTLSDVLDKTIFGRDATSYALAKSRCRSSYARLSFVPKNSKTDRSIIIEPTFMSYVQKALGSAIRDRLLKVGIDLNCQMKNRDLAMLSSVFDNLATIDLKAASDSISYMIVNLILPPDWFEALSSFRSASVAYKRRRSIFQLEKFSSMGNGFTFELESLLFFCLGQAVRQSLGLSKYPKNFAVYGDDIIIEREAFDTIVALFRYCGFNTNVDKTFETGPFRESCGGDYLNGFDIRPFYKRDTWSIHSLITFHNFCFRRFKSTEIPFYDRICRYIRGFLSHEYDFNITGPDNGSDGHLITDKPTLTDIYLCVKNAKDKTMASYKTFRSYVVVPWVPTFEDYIQSLSLGDVRLLWRDRVFVRVIRTYFARHFSRRRGKVLGEIKDHYSLVDGTLCKFVKVDESFFELDSDPFVASARSRTVRVRLAPVVYHPPLEPTTQFTE